MHFFLQNPEKGKEKEKFFHDPAEIDRLIVSRLGLFFILAFAMDWKKERMGLHYHIPYRCHHFRTF